MPYKSTIRHVAYRIRIGAVSVPASWTLDILWTYTCLDKKCEIWKYEVKDTIFDFHAMCLTGYGKIEGNKDFSRAQNS
ncbi:hypothetical protein L3X38_024102 [Prunus dulcis]|uniref:Uncharacterized protein n=1 Tax=Prunus dulcis TaxID=3755 RepID=A0AAD4Z663_PRUDU|nr:hypothetical protein L3X38_024102 [Prunus dulcis]